MVITLFLSYPLPNGVFETKYIGISFLQAFKILKKLPPLVVSQDNDKETDTAPNDASYGFPERHGWRHLKKRDVYIHAEYSHNRNADTYYHCSCHAIISSYQPIAMQVIYNQEMFYIITSLYTAY